MKKLLNSVPQTNEQNYKAEHHNNMNSVISLSPKYPKYRDAVIICCLIFIIFASVGVTYLLTRHKLKKGVENLIKPTAIFYVDRGNSWDNKGNYDRAMANYNKAIKIDPTFALAYIERGVAYASSGDYKRALQDCNKAIELDSNNAYAYKSRGDVYFYQGRFALAEADYVTYLRLKPKDIYRMLWLYMAQERAGRSGLDVLSIMISDVDITKWPGPVALLFLKRISPEELLEKAKDNDPKVEKEKLCEAYFYLGQYYLLSTDMEKAAQVFKLCMQTKVTYFVEYTGAKVELERI